MKKIFTVLYGIMFLAIFSGLAFAGGTCPQERKTKPASGNFITMDQTADANLENGKALYEMSAKPMSCNNCHGDAGDGTGKAGISATPSPTNFTCK